jgi:hypothetical protein
MEDYYECDGCGLKSEMVVKTFCPYAKEIYDEEKTAYLCDDCYEQRLGDI